jgi:hypothetical protein
VHRFCPVFVLLVTTRRRSAFFARWRRRRINSARNGDAAQATNFVIASASEAIQPLDCFVAAAPRKTGVPEKKMA